uniref:Uncharacterized protein n=1 Tax=Zea mays TaxID=4577 RepID=A0A804UHZ1_MAIZE
MQENNMNEIKRFNKERRQDLLEMLKGFVSDQATYSDHFASIWTKTDRTTLSITEGTHFYGLFWELVSPAMDRILHELQAYKVLKRKSWLLPRL